MKLLAKGDTGYLATDDLRKVVANASLWHCATTLYPGVVFTLAVLAMILFGPSMLTVTIGIFAGVVSLGSFGYHRFLKRDYHVAKHIRMMQEQTKQEQLNVLSGFNREEIERYATAKWYGAELAKTTLQQFAQLEARRGAVTQAIAETFSEGSALHGLHLETAEKVYLQLLYKFRDVKFSLMNAMATDLAYIEEGLRDTEPNSERRQALNEQKGLYEQNIRSVKESIAVIDETMVHIEKLTQAIIKTTSSDDAGLRKIFDEMGDIACRLEHYKTGGMMT